jgi:hypothetical protein
MVPYLDAFRMKGSADKRPQYVLRVRLCFLCVKQLPGTFVRPPRTRPGSPVDLRGHVRPEPEALLAPSGAAIEGLLAGTGISFPTS